MSASRLPLTVDGLKTCKALTGEGTVWSNVTLCFSANQALLAAKAGASFISPFVGRHDDNGFWMGMDLIEGHPPVSTTNYDFDHRNSSSRPCAHTTHVLASRENRRDAHDRAAQGDPRSVQVMC